MPLPVLSGVGIAARRGIHVIPGPEIYRLARPLVRHILLCFPSRARGSACAVGNYKVTYLLVDLGWVDFDLGCSTILLGQ